MTLSIEVLPAPLGPMMARISCSRISRLMSLSALMPPKARLMRSARRIGAPMCLPAAVIAGSTGLAQRCDRRRRLGVADLELGLERALAPILEAHLGLDARAGGA